MSQDRDDSDDSFASFMKKKFPEVQGGYYQGYWYLCSRYYDVFDLIVLCNSRPPVNQPTFNLPVLAVPAFAIS
jgi:hypothetical protein